MTTLSLRATVPAIPSPSIRLVVPHFGPRPAYFPLVLRSMAANPDVSWLLLTDQPVPDPPPNVEVQLCTFDDLARADPGPLRVRDLAGASVQALRLPTGLR